MIYLILRLLVAALLALPVVATEEAPTAQEGGVTEECATQDGCDTQTPSELPGPSD